ncbi:MAG: hypothetical protein EOR60_24135 [Mesorhizobium sp.]|nr:MAG: hypothetical protein EOR60_24135 [Mesorhizobium sp.]
MQQVGESNSPVQSLDEMEQQTITRIEEAEELIEENRRLIERSREILASAAELPAAAGKAKQPDLKAVPRLLRTSRLPLLRRQSQVRELQIPIVAAGRAAFVAIDDLQQIPVKAGLIRPEGAGLRFCRDTRSQTGVHSWVEMERARY